jgi:hypothetical protein
MPAPIAPRIIPSPMPPGPMPRIIPGPMPPGWAYATAIAAPSPKDAMAATANLVERFMIDLQMNCKG